MEAVEYMSSQYDASGQPVDLGPDEFANKMDEARTVVLDVRTPEEYSAAHLPGAVLLNIADPGFPGEIDALDRDTPYMVYCRSGNRSWTAGRYMIQLGFTEVYNLQDGIISWAGAVEQGAAPQSDNTTLRAPEGQAGGHDR
jgi:rhodanese-related sulfurtransferase